MMETQAMEGNNKAMREALEFVAHMNDSSYTTYDVIVAVQKAKDALSAPPRNCDVGTAEEQARRYYDNFADRYNPCSYRGYVGCAEDCPVYKKLMQEGHGVLLCQLEWAQMPYEAEEGAGE